MASARCSRLPEFCLLGMGHLRGVLPVRCSPVSCVSAFGSLFVGLLATSRPLNFAAMLWSSRYLVAQRPECWQLGRGPYTDVPVATLPIACRRRFSVLDVQRQASEADPLSDSSIPTVGFKPQLQSFVCRSKRTKPSINLSCRRSLYVRDRTTQPARPSATSSLTRLSLRQTVRVKRELKGIAMKKLLCLY